MRSRSLYYKGKSDLLGWVNQTLGLQITSLEELATGAIFCQLLDSYFSDVIPMQKVNYLASDQFESLRNFKLLQSAFNQLAIPKDVNIQKLSKGSQSELLEFLQYLYKYLGGRQLLSNYDPVERRRISKYGGTDKIPLTSTRQLESNFKFYTKKEGKPGVMETGDSRYYQLPNSQEPRPESARQNNSKEWFHEYGKRPFSARYSTGSARMFGSGRKKASEAQSPASQSGHGSAFQPSYQRQARSALEFEDPRGYGGDAGTYVPPQAVATAIEAAGQAVQVLVKYLPLLKKLLDTVGRDQDSYANRGKVRSMQDVMGTLIRHTRLLLTDLHTAADNHPEEEVQQKARRVEKLLEELRKQEGLFHHVRDELAALERDLPVPPTGSMPAIREETPDTKQLDAVLKAIGAAHASLSPFTGDGAAAGPTMGGDGGADGKPGGKSRAYKFGEYQIRRLKNGDVYKGKYVAGKKNGEGVYAFLNGDVYEGNFKDDQMEGYGVYTFAHQGRYEGHWAQAVYDGVGMETFAKGSTYHGEYSKGMRHGQGVCRYFNGDYYEGQWAQGLREGRGMQQCTDDSNYVGDYHRGRRHGYGVYSFPNNDQYLGEYEKDIPHGYGVYVFASGQKYEGEWEEGRKHGWCEYTVETGERYAGYWEQGQPKWVQSFSDLAGPESPALSEETQAKIKRATEAAVRARQAAKKGSQRAEEHWSSTGEMQNRIKKVVEASQRGALEAQKSRQKALEIAAKLDAMAEEHLKQQADGAGEAMEKLDLDPEPLITPSNGGHR